MTDDKKPKILIIEDNKQTVELIKKFFLKTQELKDLDCSLVVASDGEQAVEYMTKEVPEVILCDIGLPKKDGYEVLKHFNEVYKTENPFCFFAFLTASSTERKKAFKEGVMGYVAKNELNYFTMTLQLKAWIRLVELERKAAS